MAVHFVTRVARHPSQVEMFPSNVSNPVFFRRFPISPQLSRGIGRVIEAHGRGLTALSWAKGSRRLLTASHDHRLHLWALDPPRPELMRVLCLDSPVLSALVRTYSLF